MVPFYTPWKHQKTKSFLVFLGGLKWEHWPEMDYLISTLITRLIVIDIASLTVLFAIARCFVIVRSLIYNCPLRKDISFNTKFLLVWCG